VRQLGATFAQPRWLRDLGRTSWSLVGVGVVVVGVAWGLGHASTIVSPFLAGLIVATVAAPVVTWLARHRVPRIAGALIVLVAAAVVAVLIVLLVVGGILSQGSEIAANAQAGLDKLQSALEHAGLSKSGSSTVSANLSSDVPKVLSTLFHGIAAGIQGVASIAFGCVFTAFSLLFLLKDGPKLRRVVDRNLGVPPSAGRMITGEVIASVRRYFLGVTVVAVFNAVVVGLGAIVLGVPLAGTIAVVTAVTAYIPFIGAFVSGAFAVLLALGAQGTTAALIMLVIVILANGLLQNIVQPIAFGATLDLNPLLILVVTIGAGCFFGMAGLVLAAPLTSAVVHVGQKLAAVRASAGGAAPELSPSG
jgi:predicted PurR-regulated permease PerM